MNGTSKILTMADLRKVEIVSVQLSNHDPLTEEGISFAIDNIYTFKYESVAKTQHHPQSPRTTIGDFIIIRNKERDLITVQAKSIEQMIDLLLTAKTLLGTCDNWFQLIEQSAIILS
jgi:hypothetical protein